MANKRKMKKKSAKKASKKNVRRGLLTKIIEAVTPKRRNSPGGNITRRQGV